MEESEYNEDVDGGKAMSAYQHFSRAFSSVVKSELLEKGLDASMGPIVSAVAAKWRALTDTERKKYDDLARDDRERFENIQKKRDEEYALLQEEKRKSNAMVETETRMRGSTLYQTDATSQKVENSTRKKRELTDKEKDKIQQKRQAKESEANAISQAHSELSQNKAEQAEARLRYLLSQSDIFSHFGAGKDLAAANKASGGDNKKSGDNSAKHRRGGAAEADLDDDEKAMALEEDDSEEAAAKKQGTHVLLAKQPSCIVGGLMRQYQVEGLQWMIRLQENGINGILADEMGLGKTLQSISILAFLHEYHNISGPHLIMVPKSTLSNWMNEFAHWCPALRPIKFHGSKEERQDIVQNILQPSKRDDRDWDVCITTYEIANLEKGSLGKIAWRYLIIDEAHRLKNEASQFSQTVRLLNTHHRLLLTGTPLQNNLHELWALLNFLLPDVFASSEQFDDWFNLDVDDTEAKERMIGQLHKILRPFMLRRLKADVEKSLPPKSETILFTGMSVLQKNVYRQVLLRDIDTVNGGAGAGSGSRTAILNIVMQLRKCCNHPYLFPGVEDRSLSPMGDHLITNCGKMVLLDKLLNKMKQRDHRVLIFSQMTRMLDILEDYLVMQGYKYCRIDGNTTYEDREDRIQDFNAPGSDKFIFLLSTRAGGLGINLQTADIVILYDSDWNPQADLQAQDRCHRIGQKKVVQVFRLVTDDTVEVKVVERAQQKLKLDAMVVQHGRLQEKDKKMSRQDLLDTLRFGADKIFRTKDSNSVTDADIDLILEEGRKRTEELNEKLQIAEKGDLYDFRLDGGMSTQIFEGKDYSDKSLREAELNAQMGLPFIDPGKRERKVVATYNDTAITRAAKAAGDDVDKKTKLPRHLRLPKMDDWQFFNRTRLLELQEEENTSLEKMIDEGVINSSTVMGKLILLDADKMEEKTRLLSEGFGDWSKVHYNLFIKASAKYGRDNYDRIHRDVGRPADEVRRYADKFWSLGPTILTTVEWEKVVKQIEKGEKRLEEIDRLSSAAARLVNMFSDPWEELTFKHVGSQGRIFNAVEDRYLLCLTHLHGYGNWDRVKNSIRRCERFRFDYYLLSCSSDTLGKRCEALMRVAERELIEIDKKKLTVDSLHPTDAITGIKSRSAVGPLPPGEVAKDRVVDIMKQIEEEAKRLAVIRADLLKMRTSGVTNMLQTVLPTTTAAAGGATSASSATTTSASATAGPTTTTATATSTATAAAPGAASAPVIPRGVPQRPVPENIIPDLCRMIEKAGHDGITKIIDRFVAIHPKLAKRQVERKIAEIGCKEKRPDDTSKVWHIKTEFEHYLRAPASTAAAASDTTTSSSSGKKSKSQSQSTTSTTKSPASSSTTTTAAPAATSGKKQTKMSDFPKKSTTTATTPSAATKNATTTSAASTEKGKAKAAAATTTPASSNKRKRESEPSSAPPTPAEHMASEESGAIAGSGGGEPKKARSAFWFFVKVKRSEVEKEMSGASTSDLKDKLLSLWEAMNDNQKLTFDRKAQEDKARYEKEMKQWQQLQSGSSSSIATTPHKSPLQAKSQPKGDPTSSSNTSTKSDTQTPGSENSMKIKKRMREDI